MVKEIPLTQGQFALVDDEDFEWLNQLSWQAAWNPSSKGYYAQHTQHLRIDGKRSTKSIGMHRLILNAPKNKVVDHINHNTLDNRKENLRIVSFRQNRQNLKINTTSKYSGVCWDKKLKKWFARIAIAGMMKPIGYFPKEQSAAKAYEMAQRLYCNENLVCKIKQVSSYSTSPKFTPIWELRKKSSKYKGVCWHKHHKKWTAKIQINGKRKHLGYFEDEREAAQEYIKACQESKKTICKCQ